MTTTPIVPITCKIARDQLLLLFHSPAAAAALQQVDRVLRSEGYDKEKDAADRQLYGRGSKGGRILGGGFSSRQEFRVTVDRDGNLTLLSVQGTATVATAGSIGISKMRKELARLSGLILGQFASSPEPQTLAPEVLGRFGNVLTQRPSGRGSEYAMVIVIILIVAIISGMVAAWAVINR